MTIDKKFKQRVRERMDKTGESYATARALLLREEMSSKEARTYRSNPMSHLRPRILLSSLLLGLTRCRQRYKAQ